MLLPVTLRWFPPQTDVFSPLLANLPHLLFSALFKGYGVKLAPCIPLWQSDWLLWSLCCVVDCCKVGKKSHTGWLALRGWVSYITSVQRTCWSIALLLPTSPSLPVLPASSLLANFHHFSPLPGWQHAASSAPREAGRQRAITMVTRVQNPHTAVHCDWRALRWEGTKCHSNRFFLCFCFCLNTQWDCLSLDSRVQPQTGERPRRRGREV